MLFSGGDSTATYENVKTRMTIYTQSDQIEAGGSLGLAIGPVADADVKTCAGVAFGAALLVCVPTAKVELNVELQTKFGMNTLLSDKETTRSNEFSVTWSYTTSDNPAT